MLTYLLTLLTLPYLPYLPYWCIFMVWGPSRFPLEKSYRHSDTDIPIFRYCATADSELGIVAHDERRNAGNRYAYLTLPYLLTIHTLHERFSLF